MVIKAEDPCNQGASEEGGPVHLQDGVADGHRNVPR